MLALAIPVGLLIGLSLGALGGGGSILTVPALVYLLGQSPHEATTGSLVIVGITSLAGMVAHWRSGRVRVVPGLVFGVLGVAGSYVGSRLSAGVDPYVLLVGFAVLMLVAAAAMLKRCDCVHLRRHVGEQEHEGHPPAPSAPTGSGGATTLERVRLETPAAAPRLDVARAVKVLVAATVVGLLTGFFGVGGGFVIVPALVIALGFPMPVAVGTSLLVISINSAVALGSRLGGDTHLDWPLLGLFTLAAIAGTVLGNRVASRVSPARLSLAFTGLLVLVAVYTMARSLPQLLGA